MQYSIYKPTGFKTKLLNEEKEQNIINCLDKIFKTLYSVFNKYVNLEEPLNRCCLSKSSPKYRIINYLVN